VVRSQPGRVAVLEGLRQRFLPEAAFRGRQNAKLQYAVLAAAAVHGGTDPELLDEVASWPADDFWQYAMYAAVACIRVAASRLRLGVPGMPGLGRAPLSPGAIAPAIRAARARPVPAVLGMHIVFICIQPHQPASRG